MLIRFTRPRGDMTRHNSQPQTLPFSTASESEQSAHRLVVLVPCIEADLTPLALRVWEMAGAGGSHVRFLGLCSDAAREASLRRKLITMSAMLNDGGVSADTEIIAGSDWVKAVRSRWQAGDRLVCLAEQRGGSAAETAQPDAGIRPGRAADHPLGADPAGECALKMDRPRWLHGPVWRHCHRLFPAPGRDLPDCRGMGDRSNAGFAGGRILVDLVLEQPLYNDHWIGMN